MTGPFKEVPKDDLKAWRRSIRDPDKRGWQRGVYTKKPAAPAVDHEGDEATVTTTEFTPASPREVFNRSIEHHMTHFKRSPEDFQLMIQKLRLTHGDMLAHMSNEEAARLLEDVWMDKIEASLKKVFAKLGRDRELKINLDGY